MVDERFSFRWGIPLLDEGYTTIPNFMFRYYAGAGVTRVEFLLILHLASYKYESPNGQASPGLETIAEEMGFQGSASVCYHLRNLEAKGMLTRRLRPGNTSIYDFEGFSRKVMEAYTAEDDPLKIFRDYPLNRFRDSPSIDLGEITNRTKHQEEKHGDGDSKQLAQKLMALGITEGQAQKWASERPPEMVLGWIEYIRRNGDGLSNIPGFLVSKLKAGEEPPVMGRVEDDRRRYIEGPYAHLIEH